MYTVAKTLGVQKFVKIETIPLAIALIVAEALYKFHSFTLEAIVFLATWYLVSWASAMLRQN